MILTTKKSYNVPIQGICWQNLFLNTHGITEFSNSVSCIMLARWSLWKITKSNRKVALSNRSQDEIIQGRRLCLQFVLGQIFKVDDKTFKIVDSVFNSSLDRSSRLTTKHSRSHNLSSDKHSRLMTLFTILPQIFKGSVSHRDGNSTN